MGLLKKYWDRVVSNYAIKDMNEYYNSCFQGINDEISNNNPIEAFYFIEKLFSYDWLDDFPENHLFEKDENAKAGFYSNVCLMLDKAGEYDLALKALISIPDSSPHKGLSILEMSLELGILYGKSQDK
jgi:hypothetical protein